MKTFRTLRKALLPAHFRDENTEGFLLGYALDIVRDAFVERCRLGFLARLPQNGPNGETAPTDALDAMGRDRGVVRGIDETDVSYAARLVTWRDDAKSAGSAFGLMRELAAYLRDDTASFRTVDARGNWYSRAADGTQTSLLKTGNWNWDGPALAPNGKQRWSRFWVIVYPGARWVVDPYAWGDTSRTWGAHQVAAAPTLGSTATNTHVQTMRGIVDRWKPEWARCVNVILAFDPSSFDPTTTVLDGTWGHYSKVVGGVRVPARLSTARYLDGV